MSNAIALNGLEEILNNTHVKPQKKGVLSKVWNFVKHAAKTEYDYFTKDLRENYSVNEKAVWETIADIKNNYSDGISAENLASMLRDVDTTFSKKTANKIFEEAKTLGYVKNPDKTFKEALRDGIGKKEYFKENLFALGRTYGRGLGLGVSMAAGGLGAFGAGMLPFIEYLGSDLGFLLAQSEAPGAVKRGVEKLAEKYDSNLLRRIAKKADYYTSQAILGTFAGMSAISAYAGNPWSIAQLSRNLSAMKANKHSQDALAAMEKGDINKAKYFQRKALNYSGVSGLFMLAGGLTGAMTLDNALQKDKVMEYSEASVLPKGLFKDAKDVKLDIKNTNRKAILKEIDGLKTIELGMKNDPSKLVYDNVVDSKSGKTYHFEDFKDNLKIGVMKDRGNTKSAITLSGDLYDIAKNNEVVIRFTDSKGKSHYMDHNQFAENNGSYRYFANKNVKHAEVFSIEDVNGDGKIDTKVKLADYDIAKILSDNSSGKSPANDVKAKDATENVKVFKIGDEYALSSKYQKGLSVKENGDKIVVSTGKVFKDYNDKDNLVARVAWDTDGDKVVDKYKDFKLGEEIDLSKISDFDKNSAWYTAILDKNGISYEGKTTDGLTVIASDRHNGAVTKGIEKLFKGPINQATTTTTPVTKYIIPIIDGKKVSWAHPDVKDKAWDPKKFDAAKIGYTKDGNKYFNWEAGLSYKVEGDKIKVWANKFMDKYNDKDNLAVRIGYDSNGDGKVDTVKDFDLSKDYVNKHKQMTIDDLAGFDSSKAWYIGILDKNGIDVPGVEKTKNPTYVASDKHNGAKIAEAMIPNILEVERLVPSSMKDYNKPQPVETIPVTEKPSITYNDNKTVEKILGYGTLAAVIGLIASMKRDYSGSGGSADITGGHAYKGK